MFEGNSIKEVKLQIGVLVRALRKKQGLTQEVLGGRLGLSRATIQNLESGKNATLDTLLIAMQHFNILEHFHEHVISQFKNNNYEPLY